jgi:hypothetical protein
MNAMFGSLSLTRILRVALSLSLVFWIAGFGCIFGCESLAMAGASAHHGPADLSSSTVASGASCHKVVDHSSCPKRRQSANKTAKAALSESMLASAPIIEIAGGMMRECPMALNAKALGTKPRTDESATTIALEPIDLPIFNAVRATVSPAPSFQNNRGHTYLRFCVFLI